MNLISVFRMNGKRSTFRAKAFYSARGHCAPVWTVHLSNAPASHWWTFVLRFRIGAHQPWPPPGARHILCCNYFSVDRAVARAIKDGKQSEPELLNGMSRLDAITDWENRARRAGYHAHDLAVQVGVCERQLRRHLAERFKLPSQHWIDGVRLRDAWNFLLAGEPVKSVAFRLGFKQVSHFSTFFKRAHGIPPSACRRPAAGQKCPPQITNVRAR